MHSKQDMLILKKKTAVLFKIKKFKNIIQKIKFEKKKIMPNYIIDLLDQVTLHNKRKKWVAADLNAEMIFERLKRIKKDLFLIVLMRNPVEAICASLYWRSYPSICQNSNKVFLYKLLSCKLTLFVAKKTKKKISKLSKNYLF